ncbi:hypothetical protein D3C81_174000 [compost metagenome]
MSDQYAWNRGRSTSDDIADADDPRYETPGGAQNKANTALEDAKEYADEIPKYTQINGIVANIPDDNFSIIGGIGIRVDNGDQSLSITATGPVDIDPIPLSKVYDAGTAAAKNVGSAVGNVPVIGVDGYLDTGILPALAISDTFVINSQSAMLALNAQLGDVAVRTDLSKSYILKTAGASTLANWQELLTPTSPVQSVAGKTGVVTLTSADVGLGNVTNESKSTMFASPAFTGTPTGTTQATADNSTKLATTAYVKAQGYLVQAITAPVTLTKINSWVDVSGFYTLKAWSDSDGAVHIQGSIMSGTVGSIIANLPAGLRPTANIDMPCTANNAGDNAAIRIYANGDIQHLSGGNTLVSINGLFKP